MTDVATEELVRRFRARERPALARLISFIENDRPAGLRAMAELYRDTGNAYVVGITGPPGAGKSTLTNALIRAYRDRGETVGVIAVDPSSALTGGATLGDRIRMLENFDDPGVYIRSMATRGEMGGLSVAVGGVVHLLDAYGFDIICIETVGVGQDEVDIADLADTTVLLQVPGLGDAIQAIKAGVLEIADILVVNKADQPGANDLVRDLRTMLRLGERRDWTPPIVETVASAGSHIDTLINMIDRHQAFLVESGTGASRLRLRTRSEVARLARRQLALAVSEELDTDEGSRCLEAVEQRQSDPLHTAVEVARRSAGRIKP